MELLRKLFGLQSDYSLRRRQMQFVGEISSENKHLVECHIKI
jgi:hypothetical protein